MPQMGRHLPCRVEIHGTPLQDAPYYGRGYFCQISFSPTAISRQLMMPVHAARRLGLAMARPARPTPSIALMPLIYRFDFQACYAGLGGQQVTLTIDTQSLGNGGPRKHFAIGESDKPAMIAS